MTKYFDNWKLNDVLAVGAASRAQGAFFFIGDILDPKNFLRQEATSAPNSRQVHVLISYNFELFLNAAVFLSSNKTTEKEIIGEAKIGHKLDKLWNLVTSADIKNIIGIKNIEKKSAGISEYYEIKFNDESIIIIHDFNNIRYDISDIRGEDGNKKLRPTIKEEGSMDVTLDVLKKISTKLVDHLFSKYPQK